MATPTLRPLSVGEILDVSFTLYRRHFVALALVALLCSGVPLVLSLFLQSSGGMLVNPVLTLVYYLVFITLNALATAATVHIVSESYLGRPLGARDALARSAPLLLNLVVCSLLFGVVVMFGFLLLVIPGIIFVTGLILAFPALVLEPGSTPVAALARAWALSRGYRWRLFGLLFTLMVLLYIPFAAIGGIAAAFLPGSDLASGDNLVTVGLLTVAVAGIIQIFIYPLFYCVITVAYYDLRVRKEGFDLEVLASTLRTA